MIQVQHYSFFQIHSLPISCSIQTDALPVNSSTTNAVCQRGISQISLCQSTLIVKRAEKKTQTLHKSVTRFGINSVLMFRNGEH